MSLNALKKTLLAAAIAGGTAFGGVAAPALAQPFGPPPPPGAYGPPHGWRGPHYFWHGHHWHHRRWAFDHRHHGYWSYY